METWGTPTDFGTVCRRAGGRRRYNARRRAEKQWRRAQIIALVPYDRRGVWGVQALLAERFGVSKSTISRDFEAIRAVESGADLGALLR